MKRQRGECQFNGGAMEFNLSSENHSHTDIATAAARGVTVAWRGGLLNIVNKKSGKYNSSVNPVQLLEASTVSRDPPHLLLVTAD